MESMTSSPTLDLWKVWLAHPPWTYGKYDQLTHLGLMENMTSSPTLGLWKVWPAHPPWAYGKYDQLNHLGLMESMTSSPTLGLWKVWPAHPPWAYGKYDQLTHLGLMENGTDVLSEEKRLKKWLLIWITGKENGCTGEWTVCMDNGCQGMDAVSLIWHNCSVPQHGDGFVVRCRKDIELAE